MTIDEFNKLKFKSVATISFTNEKTKTYNNEKYGIRMFVTRKVLSRGNYGKPKKSYIYQGRLYTKIEDLLNVL